MNTKILVTISVLAALVVAAVSAYWLGARARPPAAPHGDSTPAETAALYWYDPMVPDQHFDKPGKSPFMDMQLVPKYANADESSVIRVSSAARQNLGVRTALVETGTLESSLRVPGSILWNQRDAYEISARVDGVVEKLYVRATYDRVRNGQALAEIIAPAWNAAAQEYLALEGLESTDARALREAARNRLRVLGMDAAQIAGLRQGSSGIVLRAPADGVVTALAIREGQRVQTGMPLMTINGLDTVWAEAAIPQAQSIGIRPDMEVEASASAFPDEMFAGKVESLLADVDRDTRTQRARIVLDNPDHRLTPGMFVDLQFTATTRAARPLIPDSALIATGNDARVIVESASGGFSPVRVVTGRSSAGQTEILEGLKGGERIVVSGQFLIDSEASLSGMLDRLAEPQAVPPAQHDAHEGHAMPLDQDKPSGHPEPLENDPHAGHDMHEGDAMPDPKAKDLQP